VFRVVRSQRYNVEQWWKILTHITALSPWREEEEEESGLSEDFAGNSKESFTLSHVL
jgi:hypothetical protein